MREIKSVCPAIRRGLTAIVLYVSIVSASAQERIPGGVKVTINKTNISLKEVFKQMEQQTGTRFYYADRVVNAAEKVSVHVSDMPLQQVLDKLLKERKLNWNYNAQQKTIEVVADQPASGSGNTNVAPGSNTGITVSGKVTNTTGGALSGAYVLLKGTNKGVVTGENGEFSITNVPVNGTLVFSFAGFEKEEVMVNRQTSVNISLNEEITSLGDVKVSINTGYQNFSKERFVGSFSKLDSAEFQRRAGMNILDRLDGTVTGLLFNRKSKEATLQIRGISTLGNRSSSSLPAFDPLIIVDNFPYTESLNTINPNDVLDITVLKDAAAASIWGVRAGNGVIVITTKKGKFNQPFQVNTSSNVSITEKPDLFYYPQMSSSDFIDVESFLFGKGFYNTALARPGRFVVSPVETILDKQKRGLISASDAEKLINNYRLIDVRNDYDKYVFCKAISQQHNINLSGGNNLINYNLSIGYNTSLSNIKGTKPDDQITINSNSYLRPFKNFEANVGIYLSKATGRNAGFSYPLSVGGGRGSIYPYTQLADVNGNPLATPRDYALTFVDSVGGGNLLDWHYYPLEEIRLADTKSLAQLAKINLGLSYQFTKWLKGSIQYQYTNNKGSNRNYYSQQTYLARDLINKYTNFSQTTPALRYPIPIGGILDISNSTSASQNFRWQVNVNKDWLQKHELSILVAGDISEGSSSSDANRFYGYNDTYATYATGLDYTTIFPFFAGIGSGNIQQQNILRSGPTNRLVSFTANASYSYNNRYTVYASARRDGANVFGVNTNNKWKPLWSTGVSWDISKEFFYKFSFMSLLRFRAAYGYMGNVDNARSGLPIIAYNTTSGNSITNLPRAIIPGVANPELKWEEVNTINLGMDFSILDNRISGSIEWFQKKSTDVISEIPFDITTGVSTFVVNAADLKGHGVEIQLNSKNLDSKRFKWRTVFGLAYNKTIVTKYYNPSGNKISNFQLYKINPAEGQIVYGIASYRWNGLDPLTGDPLGYYNKQVSKDYNSIINDSLKNQVFNGSAIPLYSGNMLNTFSWNRFSISANIVFRLNYYFRKPAINYDALYNSWVGNSEYAKRWQKAGDEKTTTVPSMSYPSNSLRDQFYAYSDINVLRGDNVRIQDIRFAYNWENRIYKKIPVRSAQFFVYLNNLNAFIWRKEKSDFDPDYTGGTSGVELPPSKTWTIGINIQL
jgi:TonB-linked SusC/RagA family outer membrane protein